MDVLYPESFARFYDTIYHHMRDEVDNNFFRDRILETGGRVLEVGVGTGRLFMNSLSDGADIYGLDISEEMLKILLSKLPEKDHHRISCQSVVDFKLDGSFDLIVAPFRVMMHLLDRDDQLKALNNVYEHLNNNGRFIFDTFVPDPGQLINGVSNRMDFEGEYEPGRKLRRFVTTTPDLIEQTIGVNFHLEWEEDEGIRHDYCDLPLRFFFRYELEHLIERTKFESYTIFGDYEGSRLRKGAKEFVVECVKKC